MGLNLIAYNAISTACGNASFQKQALELFREMSEHQVETDVVTYNSLISASSKILATDQAWSLVGEMERKRIESDIITSISLLQGGTPSSSLEKLCNELDNQCLECIKHLEAR